jgi:hypothetical protein
MGSFINNLIDRSTESAQSVQPRLRGKFERDITSPDFFTGNDATTFGVGDQAETRDEQFPIHHRKTTVRLSILKNLTDEPADDTRQHRVSKSSQSNTTRIEDDITPEKPRRFEPSYELRAPQNIHDHISTERQVDNSDYVQRHPNSKTSADVDNQQKLVQPKKLNAHSTSLSKTPDTKEIYKSLPVIKSAADLVAPAETPQKVHLKQPGASFRQQKKLPVEHPQTINISIGRIEVRVSQPSAQMPLKPKNEGVAVMSLDEYLRKRNQRS